MVLRGKDRASGRKNRFGGIVYVYAMFDVLKKRIQEIYPLSDEDCELFRDAFAVKTFRKNETWTAPGSICREIGFITEGIFRMYYLHDGKEINAHFFVEGEFATDYQSFLAQQASVCYISALEPAQLILFSYTKLQQAYTDSHSWERFGRLVSEACYLDAMRRSEAFLFQNGEQRYLDLMKNKPQILNRVPLYHIASYLGLERETLSRLRRKIVQVA